MVINRFRHAIDEDASTALSVSGRTITNDHLDDMAIVENVHLLAKEKHFPKDISDNQPVNNAGHERD